MKEWQIDGMTVAEREKALISDFSIIADIQERLMLLVSRKGNLLAFEEEWRVEENMVEGCQSRVWIHAKASSENNVLLAMDADSVMVKGLVALVCDIFHTGSPNELAEHELKVFSELMLDRQLTPTRLNGLANVRETIRRIGRGYMNS